MARATQSAHPIATLRENTQSLEASVTVCLAKPGKKAVHALRTTTRRIQAQLELLSMLPNLPPHDKPRRKAFRLLKKLRHAAGQVRDIDVQRELIRNEVAQTGHANRSLRKEACHLRRELRQQRDAEASHLLDLLQKHRRKLPIVFGKLLHALAPAESLTLTEARLTSLVRGWYTQHIGEQPSPMPPQDPARLHQIRKHAKLARYLSESAPQSATNAQRLAAHFDNLQQAGGEWHDWLLLADIAASELGKSAQLPDLFTAHADQSLGLYKRRLRHKI
jgi:CHAD domain-containing protein